MERRLALRAQLQSQRETVASQLAPGGRGSYPRSVTMRLLLDHPELLVMVVSWLAGARRAGHARTLLFVVRAMASLVAVPTSRP